MLEFKKRCSGRWINEADTHSLLLWNTHYLNSVLLLLYNCRATVYFNLMTPITVYLYVFAFLSSACTINQLQKAFTVICISYHHSITLIEHTL